MNTIYFHLVGGAAGDMLLGSLIELGCPLAYLKKEWAKLDLEFEVSYKKLPGFHHGPAKKLEFRGPAFKRYSDIKKTIGKSRLKPAIRTAALAVYGKLAAAERKAHGTKGEAHFHHLGEIDAILEICGFFIALDYLKVTACRVSVFPLSRPAPATLEILKGKQICPADFSWESVTPTAAALLCGSKQAVAGFQYEKSGFGWGACADMDYLAAYLSADELGQDEIIKVEVNIDDMNPQAYEPLMEGLYKAGAKEVYLQPVIMKKSRPAVVVNVLCAEGSLAAVSRAFFSHSTTFGLRFTPYHRFKREGRFMVKDTKWGKIKFRVSKQGRQMPEYADCVSAAKKFNTPFLKIYNSLVRS